MSSPLPETDAATVLLKAIDNKRRPWEISGAVVAFLGAVLIFTTKGELSGNDVAEISILTAFGYGVGGFCYIFFRRRHDQPEFNQILKSHWENQRNRPPDLQ